MKFLEVTKDDSVFRFSIDEVRAYHVIARPKERREPAHHVVQVTLKPTKIEEGGLVVDHIGVGEWKYATFQDACNAVRIVDA